MYSIYTYIFAALAGLSVPKRYTAYTCTQHIESNMLPHMQPHTGALPVFILSIHFLYLIHFVLFLFIFQHILQHTASSLCTRLRCFGRPFLERVCASLFCIFYVTYLIIYSSESIYCIQDISLHLGIMKINVPIPQRWHQLTLLDAHLVPWVHTLYL